jgi:hypothetical protein
MVVPVGGYGHLSCDRRAGLALPSMIVAIPVRLYAAKVKTVCVITLARPTIAAHVPDARPGRPERERAGAPCRRRWPWLSCSSRRPLMACSP